MFGGFDKLVNSNGWVEIKYGERYVQICAPGLIPIVVEMVSSKEELGEDTARGQGGFGSTGK